MSANKLLINLSFITPKPTGLSNYALRIYPYLKSLNPILLTSQSLPDFDCYTVPNEIASVTGTKGNIKRLVWTQLELAKIYKNLKASLLFSPIPEAPIYNNCRFIVTVHDLIPLRFPRRLSPLTLFYRYYLPSILNQAEHILCNSVATARDLNQFLNIPAQKITPTLLGYDRENFYVRPYLSPPNKPYFLYVGRHDPYKNVTGLISAFAALSNPQDFELQIAGSFDSRFTPILKTQVLELGLSEQVKFLEYVSYTDLPILLNQALALVFPSFWEGFGLPVLEAMACGTPVITSNVSSLPEVTGDAALLINPRQIPEITTAMESIINEQGLGAKLSALGLERAKLFSWETTAAKTQGILADYLS